MSRRGTIRGRPLGEVEDVELTGDQLRDFVARGQAAQRAVDRLIEADQERARAADELVRRELGGVDVDE